MGDEDRGYLLELLLTKLRYTQVELNLSQIGSSTSKLQIIGMSATMPNAKEVARWLDAELYETDYRPVPLTMLLKASIPSSAQALDINSPSFGAHTSHMYTFSKFRQPC